ncbi:hypothetical protein AURDEDRAFT_115067 [Auricularia subglabra TFB-10046 SS5]|nr:hypothetical protein AURDEDRAFT_115067 [Auricularia subglabra TFB-10046 SS5]
MCAQAAVQRLHNLLGMIGLVIQWRNEHSGGAHDGEWTAVNDSPHAVGRASRKAWAKEAAAELVLHSLGKRHPRRALRLWGARAMVPSE